MGRWDYYHFSYKRDEPFRLLRCISIILLKKLFVKSMRKKILIFGHYGLPNWGDEALLAGMLSQIDISKYAVTVVSHDPKFTQKHHGVKSVSPPPFGMRSFLQFSWIRTIRVIQEADYIIFGGGGLWQASPEKALKLWDWYLQCVLFFSGIAPKIFCLGTSFGTVSKDILTDEMKKRLQKIKYFSVRDSQSVEILKTQWGILPSKIQQTADSAFFLHDFIFEKETHVKKEKKKKIIISMREGDLSIEEENIIMKVLRKKFKKYQFEFLVMQSFQAHDEQFCTRHNIPAFFPKNIFDIQTKISESAFVLSSRLHSNILASVYSTPFCAIACREKTKNLFGKNFSIEKKYILEKNFEKLILSRIEKIMKEENIKLDFLQNQKKKLQVFFPKIFTL